MQSLRNNDLYKNTSVDWHQRKTNTALDKHYIWSIIKLTTPQIY